MSATTQDWVHDWNFYYANIAQGKINQTEIDANNPSDVDGGDQLWAYYVAKIQANDPALLTTIDIQGNQIAKTPYVTYHLHP